VAAPERRRAATGIFAARAAGGSAGVFAMDLPAQGAPSCKSRLRGGADRNGCVGRCHVRRQHVAAGLITGVTDKGSALHLRCTLVRHRGHVDHFTVALRAGGRQIVGHDRYLAMLSVMGQKNLGFIAG
jgi:hypothetical protein